MSRQCHMLRAAAVVLLLVLFLLAAKSILDQESEPRQRDQYFDDTFWESALNDPDKDNIDNPKAVTRLLQKFLLPPPPSDVPLNLTNWKLRDPSMGQADTIRKIFDDMRFGFFIECGALDGETRSNSLVLERDLNWSGLLIEADPLNFKMAASKQRKVYLSNTCLSIKPHPIVVSFRQEFNTGQIELDAGKRGEANHVFVQCFPLFTYLLAMNRTTIDYFSLDVEGSELEVLKTIPWDRVNIRTLSVEHQHIPQGKEALRSYMDDQGYSVHIADKLYDYSPNDFIFVKRS